MSGDALKNASRAELLRRHTCLITNFGDELRDLLQLSREERLRRYGTVVLPILVPLDPGEPESQHERRFQIWLSRNSSSLSSLRDDPFEERRLRMLFANIKVRDYDRDKPSSKRRREDDDEYEANSDDQYYEEPEAESYVHRQTKKSRSVVLDDEPDEAKERPRKPSAPANLLLRKRVLPFNTYCAEVERDSKQKPTPQERIAMYGTTVTPVPVPLYPGETVEMYERNFRAFLSNKSLDVRNFADDPNGERSLRMNYARQRALRGRHTTDVAQPAPVSGSILDRVGEGHRDKVEEEVLEFLAPSSTTSTAGDQEPAISAEATEPERSVPVQDLAVKCTRVMPPPPASYSEVLASFLDCACQSCIVQCSRRLVSKVAALEKAVAAKPEVKREVTPTEDAHSSNTNGSSAARGVDVAKMVQITTLLRSRRSSERQSSMATDDPIEQQLQDQYDEINDRVVLNQRVLDSSAERLIDTPYDQVTAATISQTENLELRDLIEEEIAHRNAALAILIVYMWRNARKELEQRAKSAQASNVAHVQRVCHHKCASLSTEFAKHRSQAGQLKQQLEQLLADAPPMGDLDAEASHWSSLERVGGDLTRVETKASELHAARRREYATLLHFDSHLRELVCTLITDT